MLCLNVKRQQSKLHFFVTFPHHKVIKLIHTLPDNFIKYTWSLMQICNQPIT